MFSTQDGPRDRILSLHWHYGLQRHFQTSGATAPIYGKHFLGLNLNLKDLLYNLEQFSMTLNAPFKAQNQFGKHGKHVFEILCFWLCFTKANLPQNSLMVPLPEETKRETKNKPYLRSWNKAGHLSSASPSHQYWKQKNKGF